ncbi:MAG: hypothetical protein GQ477_03105 [Nanohaloarchaea archaeon]|nr:hypothetical protein [Candidatus Nanohaloarchaea archaeon]
MANIEIISSINSLVLTFIIIGFGYLSILLGYYLSKKQDDFFSGKLTAIDKTTLSFIIGSFSFLSLLFLFNFKIEIIDNFIEIILYQSLLSLIFAMFIAFILKDSKK